jgi:integrase
VVNKEDVMPRQRGNGVRRPYRYTDSRGNIRWKASIDIGKGANGKRRQRQVTAATYAKCKAKLDRLQEELRIYGETIDRSITLGDYAERFLETKKATVDPATYRDYKSNCYRYCDNWLGTPLADFTPSTIRAILAKARDEELSISIRRRIRITLNGLFKMALGDGIVKTNPVSGVQPPSGKDIGMRRRQAFSVPDMQAMLKAAADMPVKDGSIWWWRLLTGMRQGEIIGSVLEDLHLDDTTPYYIVRWKQQTIPSEHGCGDPVNSIYPCGKKIAYHCPDRKWRVPDGYDMRHLKGSLCLTRPKSESTHIAPLLPELKTLLQRYLTATEKWPNPHGLIFRHENGDPITAKEESAGFKHLMELAKLIPGQHTGHETRYALVTMLRAAHVDPKIVQSIVGHSSIEVDDIYYTLDNGMRAEAMSNIDSSLNLAQIEWKK